MKTVGAAIAILLLSACGTTPAASTSPASSPNPRTVVALLQSSDASKPDSFDSVVVVGLDGKVLASATFTPLPTPNLGCMGAILPPSAHVAAGKVFYADGHGTIRSLATDGTQATVAQLPLTSAQQMLSFAVSPDAKVLIAGIFTAPVNAFQCNGSSSGATYTFDGYSGPVGGSMRLISHQSWTGDKPVMTFTGWDSKGPIGRFPSVWASQGGGPGSTLGAYARIDPATLHATALGDPSLCLVWDSIASGEYACTAAVAGQSSSPGKVTTTVNVRTSDSFPEWSFNVVDENAASSPFLSPDAGRVVVCCNFDTAGEFLVSKDGKQSLLAGHFYAAGWLDSNTVFGWTDATKDRPLGIASYVSLGAPNTVVKLGVSGRFVGAIPL